jgi:hypothetical protein
MLDMRRRDFLTLLGGVAAMAWPVSGRRPLVAWLSLGERSASWAFVQSFLQGMRDFGYTEGGNFDFAPGSLMVTSSGCRRWHRSWCNFVPA